MVVLYLKENIRIELELTVNILQKDVVTISCFIITDII